MKRLCSIIYNELQQVLDGYNSSELAVQDVEHCFQVANRIWYRLRDKLKSYQFKNDDKEIEFFKFFKPKFTSEIEYYSLLYHSILFQPLDPVQANIFWCREYQRLEKFETENSSFLFCYSNKHCGQTPYFFLRRHYMPKPIPRPGLYDVDTGAITNGDQLVATFLALIRYRAYTENKIVSLSGNRIK
jgi:hypothetical protein